MRMSFTSPKETMSRLKPGYLTVASLSRICASVMADTGGLLRLPSAAKSIALAHIARQDAELGAVFCHRAARDRDAALAEDFHDFLIAQRILRVLVFHEIGDCLLHAG